MASQKVTLELTVAQANAVRNILNVANSWKELGSAMEGMGKKGAGTGDKLDKGFSAVNGSINRAVKAFVSLNMGMRVFQGLISIIRRELEKTERFRLGAAEQEVETGRIMKGIGRILPEGSDRTLDEIRETIRRDRGKVPTAEVAEMVRTAVSGGAKMPISERVDAGIAMAKVLDAFTSEEKAVAGRAAVQLQETFDTSSLESTGTFLQMMGISSIADPGKVANNMVQAVTQLKQFGFSLRDAAIAVTSLQLTTKDPHGRLVRTALLGNFEKILRAAPPGTMGSELIDFVKGSGRFEGSKKSREFNKKFLGLLEQQSKDAAKADAVELALDPNKKGKMAGRAAIRAGVRSMFMPDPSIGGPPLGDPRRGDYDKYRQVVARDLQVDAEGFGRILEKSGRTTASTMVYEYGRAVEKAKSRFKELPGVAAGGETLKLLENISKEAGLVGVVRDPLERYRSLMQTPHTDEQALVAASGIVDRLIDALNGQYLGKTAFNNKLGIPFGGGMVPLNRPFDPLTETRIQILTELKDEISRLRSVMEKVENNTGRTASGVEQDVPVLPDEPPVPAAGISGGPH